MLMHFKPLSIVLINIAIIGMIAMHFIPNQQTEAVATVDHTIIEQLKVESTKQNQIQQSKQQAIIKQLSLKKQYEMKRLAEKTKEKQQTTKTENTEQATKTEDTEQTTKTENIEQTTRTENIEQTNTTSIQTVKEKPQENIQPTDGFNFNGYHYDIHWFSGDGYVPADQYIYQWTELPNHYLIEKYGQAGNTIWTIQVGTQIIINGQSYICYKILNHISRLNGYDVLINEHATISAQTCEVAGGDLLTLWFFK